MLLGFFPFIVSFHPHNHPARWEHPVYRREDKADTAGPMGTQLTPRAGRARCPPPSSLQCGLEARENPAGHHSLLQIHALGQVPVHSATGT